MIITGDVREQLATLPSDHFHCVVTSPPYWALRQYLFDGAVVFKSNVTPEQRAAITAELEKIGVMPKC